MKPTLHRDWQVGQRIQADLNEGFFVPGRIAGIAMEHAIFIYIVLLDTPIQVPGHDVPWEAVTVPGGQIHEVPTFEVSNVHVQSSTL